jgi:tetratricopeptide (TPR) repeat protein
MPSELSTWLRTLSFAFLAALFSAGVSLADRHENWIAVKSPHFTIYSNAGEHGGRKVAAQFEQIRAMFEQNFPKLRVDFGKPTIVYVLKDENSLKLLMPGYGQTKNAMKIAGFYRPSFDKNFAIVRTDVTGTGSNPYHVMYHEWAHGLFRLNYRGLPLWLDEGLAEYWGGSEIDNKEARVGMADARQLRLLQQNPLLPISTLVSIDGSSPLYNTQDHAGVFYAESWVVVHYFSLAAEVREQHLLDKFLAVLQETDDPIEAANRSFGDLKKVEERIEAYTRRQAFVYQKIALKSEVDEKQFGARKLSPAEGLVVQADYLIHSDHLPEAIEALHQAESLDPKTARLHDELGYYHYAKSDLDHAAKEFDLALAADPHDATAYLYRSYILVRKSGYTKDSTPQVIANLEKVISLQPDFAPAHAFLSVAYIQAPEMKGKALDAAKKAMDLEPGNLSYYIDAGKALLASGDLAGARRIADRAQKTATWPGDRRMAAAFAKNVNNKMNPVVKESQTADTADALASEPGSTEHPRESSEKEGQITELICGHPPSVMFTLATGDEQFLLQVKDIGKLEIHDAGGNNPGSAGCAKWKDRRARVAFTLTPDGPAHGEVSAISFK